MSGIIENTTSGVITTSKSIVATHPIAMAIIGGAIIAGGVYYWMQKRKADTSESDVEVNAEAATA